MAASLVGLEAEREAGDEQEVERAIRRVLLLYAVAASYGGITLVYMGDEIVLGDDHRLAQDKARAGDRRWLKALVVD